MPSHHGGAENMLLYSLHNSIGLLAFWVGWQTGGLWWNNPTRLRCSVWDRSPTLSSRIWSGHVVCFRPAILIEELTMWCTARKGRGMMLWAFPAERHCEFCIGSAIGFEPLQPAHSWVGSNVLLINSTPLERVVECKECGTLRWENQLVEVHNPWNSVTPSALNVINDFVNSPQWEWSSYSYIRPAL